MTQRNLNLRSIPSLITYPKCWTVLRPGLASVVEPRGQNIRVAEPSWTLAMSASCDSIGRRRGAQRMNAAAIIRRRLLRLRRSQSTYRSVPPNQVLRYWPLDMVCTPSTFIFLGSLRAIMYFIHSTTGKDGIQVEITASPQQNVGVLHLMPASPARLYTLEPVAVTGGTPAPVTVAVGPVTIPAEVDQPEFVIQPVFPAAPEGAVSPPASTQHPEITLSPGPICRHFAPAKPAPSSKTAPLCASPVTAAPRFSATSRQTTAALDGSPSATTSSSAHVEMLASGLVASLGQYDWGPW
jgi:hypothetical protein